ncbi:hypothetical protein LZ32DRAFT_653557 [Colletotrichum eremochloae]|nr:hypothetical protein LZ32DRAFT_653557 [Colletotrichum eremochloae]
MAGLCFALYIRVVVKMNGQTMIEHDDPDADKTDLETPFVCCKLIKIKEGASFSIDIHLGRGIRNIFTSDDSALMVIVHLGSQEVIKRLVTKKTLVSGKPEQHRLLLEGIYEKIGKSRQALKRFRFATSDKNGNIAKSSIRVDFYIVKLLSQPEREPLVDMTFSGSPPRAIIFETEETKKPSAADTYKIKRLNHGKPFATFMFHYQTRGTLSAVVKPKCKNASIDEDLIDLNDVQSATNISPVFDTELQSRKKASGTVLPSKSSPSAVSMDSQVDTVTRLFEDLLTLVDSEEDKTEMNRLYMPLHASGVFDEMGERNEHDKTEDDEAISIQSIHDTNHTACRKRKAALVFGESSSPRPRKTIALSE